MKEMNKTSEAAANGSSRPHVLPFNAPLRRSAPTIAAAPRPQAQSPRVQERSAFQLQNSEGGFNFSGVDSLGNTVNGFVQTQEPQLAEKELERAGISVVSISEKRGSRQKNRRPKSIEFATLAEQFGDLMEIGESPTQVCRLLAYAQTNTMLQEALLDASVLIMNGRSLSEAFSEQVDNKGERLFPITFICALRIGEEVGSASDFKNGESKSAFLLT